MSHLESSSALLVAVSIVAGCQSSPDENAQPAPPKQTASAQGAPAFASVPVAALSTAVDITRSYAVPHADLSHVPALAFRRDGVGLLAGTAQGEVVAFVGSQRSPEVLSRGEPVTDLRLLPDDRSALVLRADGRLVLRDLVSGTLTSIAQIESARRLSVDAAGARVAVARGAAIEIRALPSLSLQATFAATGQVNDVTWTANGALASVSEEGVLLVRHPDGRVLARESVGQPLYAVASSPAGRHLAYGGRAKKVWQLDLRTGRSELLLGNQPYFVTTLGYAPQGDRLALGDESCDVWIVDLPTKVVLVHDKHHAECWLTRVVWSPQGERFLFGCRPNTLASKPAVYAANVTREIRAEPETRRLQDAERKALDKILEQAKSQLGDEGHARLLAMVRSRPVQSLGGPDFPSPTLGLSLQIEESVPDFPGDRIRVSSEPDPDDQKLVEELKADPKLRPLWEAWVAARGQHARRFELREKELSAGFQINVWELK
jgi:hypothetical protein